MSFQGREDKALEVLRKVYLINNPGEPDGYKVKKLIEELEPIDEDRESSSANPFVLLCNQTKLLFIKENFRKTSLICMVQFLMYGSCHGLYMFFPEIVDNIATFADDFPMNRSTICEILSFDSSPKAREIDSLLNITCNDKIEVATFGHSLVLEILYMFGFLIITFLINRVSKLSILITILFGCCINGVATLFVRVPIISIYLYIAFMLTFLGVNIVCAATCNLYPTKLRGIAINVSMMFGRIGSVLGTFLVGKMLDGNCEMTFSVSAALMGLCGLLCAFIPEIMEVDGRK